jgi:hypothetical protein
MNSLSFRSSFIVNTELIEPILKSIFVNFEFEGEIHQIGQNFKDFIDVMTILLMTLLIMSVLKAFNTGDITFNDIAYNRNIKKHVCNVTFINFIIKVFTSIVIASVYLQDWMNGQTSANRLIPGPSFQLKKWPFLGCEILESSVKLPDLKLKTRPKQLLGILLLVITLPTGGGKTIDI